MSHHAIADRAWVVERRKALPPDDLSVAHLRILEHVERGGIVAGWERWWDDALIDLEAWGLMKGEWIGSLAHEAHPYWSITQAGRKALEEHEERKKANGCLSP